MEQKQQTIITMEETKKKTNKKQKPQGPVRNFCALAIALCENQGPIPKSKLSRPSPVRIHYPDNGSSGFSRILGLGLVGLGFS